jgi:hydrogenase expression/formation protein HypC
MCLAVPGRVVSVDEPMPGLRMARVDFGGVVKNICIDLVDARAGDYVLAHAGVALTLVDTQEAQRQIKAFNEMMTPEPNHSA